MSQLLAGKLQKVARCPVVAAYYKDMFKVMVFIVYLTVAEIQNTETEKICIKIP